MRDGNADSLAGPRRLETTDHALESTDADVQSAVRTDASSGVSGRRAPPVDDGERGSERDPDEQVSIRMNDRCATCTEYIGPRAYRLSRVIDTAVATLEIHYCSETCFLARDRPAGSSASDQRPDEGSAGAEARGVRSTNAAENDSQPRDWSYCR